MSKAKFGRKFLKCCICGEKIPTEEAMLHWLNDGYGGGLAPLVTSVAARAVRTVGASTGQTLKSWPTPTGRTILGAGGLWRS